ncbi:MAG: hypothetical protein J0M19_14790, partial [Sphingomonadales bacterium]|nr:hypothetical protein [Sphingomonadales bacterium]
MIERPDPAALMAGPLGQWLTAQNAEREAVKARAARITMTGVAAAVGVAFLIAIASGEAGAALKVGLIIGALGFGIAYASKRPMITKLKGGDRRRRGAASRAGRAPGGRGGLEP